MNSTMVTTTLALPGYVVAKLMCEQAEQLGANAIIGMHYDATEVMPGLTEVLCYGTAVTVKTGA